MAWVYHRGHDIVYQRAATHYDVTLDGTHVGMIARYQDRWWMIVGDTHPPPHFETRDDAARELADRFLGVNEPAPPAGKGEA